MKLGMYVLTAALACSGATYPVLAQNTAEDALTAANDAIETGDSSSKDNAYTALLADGCNVSFVSGQMNAAFDGSHLHREYTVDVRKLLFDQVETRENSLWTFGTIPSSPDEVIATYILSGISPEDSAPGATCGMSMEVLRLPQPGADSKSAENCSSTKPLPALYISFPEPGQLDRIAAAISALTRLAEVCETQ